LSTLGPASLEWERGWPLENTLLPHICYHTKFGRSGQTMWA